MTTPDRSEALPDAVGEGSHEDLTHICWTQWLRAHEGDEAAAPVRPAPPPTTTAAEIARLFPLDAGSAP